MKASFFDIDGTLVNDLSGVSFLAFLTEKGIFKKSNKERLQETTKKYKLGQATYEEFAKSWGDEIAEGLKGQKQEDVYKLTEEFWNIIKPKFAYWAKSVIALFNSKGFITIAISGSPLELINCCKEKLGLQEVFATTLEVKEGMYTGKLVINMVLSKEKEMVFNQILSKQHIDLQASFGFGDNGHDRAFLDKVGHPIVIGNEHYIHKHAKHKGWPIFEFSDNVEESIRKLLLVG